MPELPEVETVREGVHHHAVGRVIERVRILDERSIRRHIGGSADFTMRLEGTRIRGAYRRGKYMWLTLSASDDEPSPKPGDSDDALLPYALVIHLGMSGQLLVKTPEFPAEKHLKIVLELEPANGDISKTIELRFVDQRIFGGMFLSEVVPGIPAGASLAGAEEIPEELLIPEAVEHIGRDPVDPYFDVAKIRRIIYALPAALNACFWTSPWILGSEIFMRMRRSGVPEYTTQNLQNLSVPPKPGSYSPPYTRY